LGCIECTICRLLLPMIVCQSVSLSVCHMAQLGSLCRVCSAFAAAFAKLLWPLVYLWHASYPYLADICIVVNNYCLYYLHSNEFLMWYWTCTTKMSMWRQLGVITNRSIISSFNITFCWFQNASNESKQPRITNVFQFNGALRHLVTVLGANHTP